MPCMPISLEAEIHSRITAIKTSSEKENLFLSSSSSRTAKKKISLRKTKVSEITKEMISNSLRDSNDDTDVITEENHKATINIDSEEDVDTLPIVITTK
ncbi:940_t:CDS:1, partial [Paraglomus occultum]